MVAPHVGRTAFACLSVIDNYGRRSYLATNTSVGHRRMKVLMNNTSPLGSSKIPRANGQKPSPIPVHPYTCVVLGACRRIVVVRRTEEE